MIARDVPQVTFNSYTTTAGVLTWLSDSTTPVTSLTTNMLVNVGLTVLNDRTAVQLKTKAQWQNLSSPVIQQNAEFFNLRMRPQVP
jgi:hypothetical protein